MAPPAPAPLQDLGALVLGDHPLDLEQEVVLGAGTDRSVDEHHLGTGPSELLDQQDLVGVAARQAVGSEDVDAVDQTARHPVAQPLQSRAPQGGAAEPLVDKDILGLERDAVGADPVAQRGHLAVHGVAARLLISRNPCVKGDLKVRHPQPSDLAAWLPRRPSGARPSPDAGA